jgi:hypothetical protein
VKGATHRRTADVDVTLQLWPQPPGGPDDLRPYWWGLHDLSFYTKHGHKEVWHQQFPELDNERTSGSARVEWTGERFGWVLKLHFSHEKALPALDILGLRNPPGKEPRHGYVPPPTVQHLALHLAKDAGLLAAAAEKLDHEDEVDDGTARLREWFDRRAPNVRRTLALLDDHARRLRRGWS